MLLGTAWDALRPGSAALAAHEWQVARAQAGDDFTDPLYHFCALAQRDVAPWQAGAAEARSRLDAIGAGRRAALADDRGADRRVRAVAAE